MGKFNSILLWVLVTCKIQHLTQAHVLSMKYLSEKIQISFLSRSLLHGASHAACYSLCVQLHVLMAIPDVESVGRFKIVTLQNLNILQPEWSPQTVWRWNSGCQQARRTQQEEITELEVTSKPHNLNIIQHLSVEFQGTFHKEVQLSTTNNTLSLLLHRAFRTITLIINQQMHLYKISH